MKYGITIFSIIAFFALCFTGLQKSDFSAFANELQSYTEAMVPVKTTDAPKSFAKPPAIGTKATCPVTGNEFLVTMKTLRSEYKGRYYVFCCPECKPKFDANPEKYADK